MTRPPQRSRASSGPVVRRGKGPDVSLPIATSPRPATWRRRGGTKIANIGGIGAKPIARPQAAELAPEILQVIEVVAEVLLDHRRC
jgi:hypothetical protein